MAAIRGRNNGVPSSKGSRGVYDVREGPVVDDGSPARRSERRRLGRMNEVSQSLIELFRGEAASERDLEKVREDGLAPAIGIAVGLALAVPIWVMAGIGYW